MQLNDYVGQVHDQLVAAAALGDDRTQQIAATLTGTAGPAVRLAILAALSDAAEEITAALLDSPGSPTVTVRLDGEDVRVEVVGTEPGPGASPPTRPDEGDASARITLRLPESLKADIEQSAGGEGISVNTWLLRAAQGALNGTWRSGWGPNTGTAAPGGARRGGNPHHLSGWING